MKSEHIAAGFAAWASLLAACGSPAPGVVAGPPRPPSPPISPPAASATPAPADAPWSDGAACPTERALRCRDATAALQCQAGHVAVVPCRGPMGCHAGDGPDVQCDDDLALEGDRCQLTPGGEGYACTPDFTREVSCKSGERFVLRSTCRGPARCSVTGMMLRCDDTIANVGDPCTPSGADSTSCSSDGKSETRCDGASGAVVQAQACRGPKACRVDRDTVHCDVTVAREGESVPERGPLHVLRGRQGAARVLAAAAVGEEARVPDARLLDQRGRDHGRLQVTRPPQRPGYSNPPCLASPRPPPS